MITLRALAESVLGINRAARFWELEQAVLASRSLYTGSPATDEEAQEAHLRRELEGVVLREFVSDKRRLWGYPEDDPTCVYPVRIAPHMLRPDAEPDFEWHKDTVIVWAGSEQVKYVSCKATVPGEGAANEPAATKSKEVRRPDDHCSHLEGLLPCHQPA